MYNYNYYYNDNLITNNGFVALIIIRASFLGAKNPKIGT